MVRFGYAIAYVDDVENELTFFESAFGLKRRFVHPSGDYGELDTGSTVLALASHDLGESNVPGGYVRATPDRPLGMEIALVTTDVDGTHQNATAHGARELKGPETKPWGQVVSYVVTPSGVLVEICTPVGG